MQCTEFELIYEGAGPAELPPAAAQHASACAACRGLAADLDLIRGVARELTIAPQEAPPHVWANVRAQLRAEGIIREQSPVTGWTGVLAWLRQPAVLGAYAAVALLAVGLVWQPSDASSADERIQASAVSLRSRTQLDAMERAFATSIADSKSEVDAALRKNLSVVDNFIALCEKTVRQEPHNEAARQYLFGAYQQKAELLNTAMEHSFTGE
jgi:hypothetical protein